MLFLFLFLILSPAIALLLFPNLNRQVKATFIAIVTALLVYISINLVTTNMMYIFNDELGVMFLASYVMGAYFAIGSGFIVWLFYLIAEDLKEYD